MAELDLYKLSMTGAEADSGIRTGIQAGAVSGVLFGGGDGSVRAATPGTDYGYPLLQGNGAPNNNTAANLGQHYFDMAATQPPYEYICVGYNAQGFVWLVFGDTGNGFKILGYFASLEALDDAINTGAVKNPEAGDAYGIGEAAPYDIYIWDKISNTWVNNGPLGGGSGGSGVPPHGNTGQALVKYSDEDYDAGWGPVSDIAPAAIGAMQLAPGSVTNTALDLSAVGTPNVQNAAITRNKLANDAKAVNFDNISVPVNAWKADSTFADFPYAADIVLDGVSENHSPSVIVAPSSDDGTLSRVANAYDNKVVIYADTIPSEPIEILSIVCTPVGDLSNGAGSTPPESSGGINCTALALGAYVTPTASGSIASFDDGADGLPVKSLVVDIEPVQEGSGDPSPDNVLPISGQTGVNITRAGKNLFDNTASFSVSVGANIEPTATGVKVTARYDGGPYYGYIKVCPLRAVMGKPLYIRAVESSATSNLNAMTVYYGNTDGTGLVRAWTITINGNIVEHTITVSHNEQNENRWLFIGVNASDAGEPAGTWREYNELVVSLDGYAYEPYQGDTYVRSFPDDAGTVYGGKLNWTNGQLMIDRAYIELDGSADESWSLSTIPSGVRFDFFKTDLGAKPYALGVKPNITSNKYLPITGVQSYNGASDGISLGNNVTYGFFINDSRFTDVESFRASLNNAPLQVVYELAMPITYQLTATDFKTLLGVNNIYSSTGETTVTYRADPTLIYNKLTAAIISSGGTV